MTTPPEPGDPRAPDDAREGGHRHPWERWEARWEQRARRRAGGPGRAGHWGMRAERQAQEWERLAEQHANQWERHAHQQTRHWERHAERQAQQWERHARRWEEQARRWEAREHRRWDWENRGERHPGGAAFGILVLTVLGTLLASSALDGYAPLDVRGWALAVAGPLLLGARKKAPIPVAIVISVVMSAYYLLGYPPGPAFLAQVVALNAVLLASRRWVAWTIAGVGYAGFVVAENTIGRGPGVPLGGLIAAALWTALVLVGTEAGRAARERAEEYRARRVEVERSKQEGERRRVSDERLRIAREVHDLLGHHLSLINVQSGVALHLMDSGTGAATEADLRSALAAIKQSSKDALVELRATVNALRGVDEDAPRQPTPTLDRLDDLLAGARNTGLDVSTVIVGERRPLPARVDLAAFRIIQEALTNVRRHAGPVPAVVTLEYGGDLLVVRIEDGGLGSDDAEPPDVHLDIDEPPEGGGNGIPGMRERAQSVGGTLQAGPLPDGGFRVCAELPTDEA
ncbi:histidine kinase [Cryptosporangium phraense]|uniref:histidine kinase n=1 Tax=Cryptosporangium phraense TaxID=2593070 RepID=A0A545APM7_9ACTN|nr:histidine kinase [Cryptosporangium phraense]TQS43256.1 sensor histidine kinase [Cryptosporangium phraense]